MSLRKMIVLSIASVATALALGGANAADKPIELTLSTYVPPAYEYIWDPVVEFIEYVETESKGRVKINAFHSGQLFDGYEELAAVSRGDIDITNLTSTCGLLPVSKTLG